MRKSGVFLSLITAIALLMAINVEPDAMGGAWTSADWNQAYGGAGIDAANSLIQTSDGGYALAGHATSFGAGGSDFWLVKTDSSGNAEWNRTYGGTGGEIAYSVAQTSNGGYALAGYTYSFGSGGYDFWLVKTDSVGKAQWNKTYGGGKADFAYSMVQTSDGGYALAGQTQSFGAGGSDFWLVKTDSSGNAEWNRTYGGGSADIAHFVVRTEDGGYAIAGRTQSFGSGGYDFWLVKTDSVGKAQWNKTYGGENNDGARSLIQSADGGYALAGDTLSYGASAYDFLLVKTDSSGSMEWSKTYGGSGSDVPQFLLQPSCGGYAIAGYTTSFGAGGSDFWLVKADAQGKPQWNKTSGGTASDVAFSAILTSDGGYALAGYTYSFAVGSSDFWLVKLTPSPIYIHANGSIDPPAPPMSRDGDVYTLTEDVYAGALNGIVIERDNVVLDGADHLLQGTGYNTGILVQGRSNVTIRNMTVRAFALGINLSDSLNNVIQANSIRDCETGVGLFRFSSGNAVSGNSIAATEGYGIHIESSSNNLLTGNNVRDNHGGIRLLQCTNLAYHNNFINNTVQISTIDSVNEWDDGYPSGGNYWSDYTGGDVDGDGIGDTPYDADAGNQDNHPLMTPYPYFSGDINRDGIISQLDLEMLNIAYSSTPTSTNWSPNADANNDHIIGVQDLRILGRNYGKTTKL